MRKILAIAILAACIITAGCQKSMTKEEIPQPVEKVVKKSNNKMVNIAGHDFNITSKTEGWTILQGTTQEIHDVIYNAMKKIQINVGSGSTDVLSGQVHVKLADGHQIYFNMKFITTDSTKLYYRVNGSGLSEVHLNYLLEQIVKGMQKTNSN